MKLSEAILLGSTLSPQAFGVAYAASGGRCAFAAAADATGTKYEYVCKTPTNSKQARG